jgi:hypothetical protein
MVLRRSDNDSLPLAIAAAFGTAIFGLVIATHHSRVFPTARACLSKAREWRHMSARLTAEFFVAISASVVTLTILTAWNSTLDEAGALRAAQVMMGPLTVLFAASTLYMQPRMVEWHRSGEAVIKSARTQSTGNTVATLIWIVVAMAVPTGVGVRLFGASWAGMQDVLLLVGVSFLGLAISSGPLTALRSRGQFNAGLAAQCLIALVVVLSMGIGGLMFSEGTLRGFAIGNLLASGIAWWVLKAWRVHDMIAARS